MATTKGELRGLVRMRLRDVALPYHVGDPELDSELAASMVRVAGKVSLGEKWVAGAVAVTAGSDVATLPAGVEYAIVSALRRSADGTLLIKCTVGQMEREYWPSQIMSTKTPADPTHYALTEDETNLVTVRFQAPVMTTGTLDLRRAVLPADLDEPITAAPLSALLREAVADYAAAGLVAKLSQAELDQLRLDRGVLQLFMARGNDSVRDELVRLGRQNSTGSQRR